MIPKIIHFCWLSDDPYPELIQKCMESWHKIMPDYEFVHWDLQRFPVNKSLWVAQAYKYKKYAFAADYIRLYALYHYGGFYLDTDVEVLKSFDNLLNLETAICWQSDSPGLEVAAFGVPPHCEWVKKCLDRYENRPFINADGVFDNKVLPEVVENILKQNNYIFNNINRINDYKNDFKKNSIQILPSEYFSPKSYKTGIVRITKQTYCIHHFEGSWKRMSWYEKIDKWIENDLNIKINPLGFIVRKLRTIFVLHQ